MPRVIAFLRKRLLSVFFLISSLTVSLISNPSGYKVGAVNTVAIEILPANDQTDLTLDVRQGTPVVAATRVPVVTISAKPSVVVEGGKAVLELISQPAPPTDIEIEIKFSGDAVENDDYIEIKKKVEKLMNIK